MSGNALRSGRSGAIGAKLVLVALVSVIALLSVAGSAKSAPAQVRFSQGFFDVYASTLSNDVSQTNEVVFTLDGTRITASDTAGLTPYFGVEAICTVASAELIDCPTAGLTSVQFGTWGGDDRVELAGSGWGSLRAVGDLGSGTDVFLGNDGEESARGGPGSDELRGFGGDDILEGDGEDPISGDDSPPGDDLLEGGAGNDGLLGGPGDDQLFAGPGTWEQVDSCKDNPLPQGEGADILDGGDGQDVIAVCGSDTAYGGPGMDNIQFEQRRDPGPNEINCGPDPDYVTPGPGDFVNIDCENVFTDIACPIATCEATTTVVAVPPSAGSSALGRTSRRAKTVQLARVSTKLRRGNRTVKVKLRRSQVRKALRGLQQVKAYRKVIVRSARKKTRKAPRPKVLRRNNLRFKLGRQS